jgi:putative N6-adenine-specific DNA methylase
LLKRCKPVSVDSQQDYCFRFITPIGFEQTAARECELWLKFNFPKTPFPPKCDRGFFELNLPLQIGFHLNTVLKCPSQVRLVIARFRCRDFPSLFKKTAALNWSDYLSGQEIVVKAESKKSRVKIKKRIQETVFKAIQKASALKDRAEPLIGQKETLKVLVRLDEDICEISLNTSGELLHFRGSDKHIVDAPIRENLAACLLHSALQEGKSPPAKAIIDPMAGSGTLLTEAATLFTPNSKRSFSYMSFPCSKKLPAAIWNPPKENPFETFYGFDQDPTAVEVMKHNTRSLHITGKVLLKKQDLFNKHPPPFELPNWLFINPPYGERLKIDLPIESYFADILTAACKQYQPALVGTIAPKTKNQIGLPKGYKLRRQIASENGGLHVYYMLIERA